MKKQSTTPEELDEHLESYFDALPPLDDDPEFDEGIIRDAVQHRVSTLENKRIPVAASRRGSLTEKLLAFLSAFQPARSPKLAWVVGIACTILVIATFIFTHRNSLDSIQNPLASELPTPTSDTSEEVAQTEGQEIGRWDADREDSRGLISDSLAEGARETEHRRAGVSQPASRGKSMQFASIPVVFNLRGMESVKTGTVSENLDTAMKIISRTLERNGIAFTTDPDGQIVTSIMVWDASSSSNEKVPLRFVADIEAKSVVTIPVSLIPDAATKEIPSLKALHREIQIEIEDELRYR
ncbi:MAG: hypothetical protein WBQ23_04980 [Bacteroidota bacterium]